MKFLIPIIPTAQARGRAGINKSTGRAMIYHGKNQNRNSRDLIALMAQYAPPQPLAGPLKLVVEVVRAIPTSWSKKKRSDSLEKNIWPTSKPDIDNFLKQVMDCMTALRFWPDDAAVVMVMARKSFGENPRWEIELEEIR